MSTEYPSCIGCGYCCIKSTCQIGLDYFNNIKPCPGLKWNGERHICLLASQFKNTLSIGEGCCSNLNSWRREPLINRINIKE